MVIIKQNTLILVFAILLSQQVLAKYLWSPAIQSTFYYQITGVLNKGVQAQVYFIDFLRNQAAVAELKAQGKRVVCNFSIGFYESDLDDANKIPKYLIANPVPGKYRTSYINYAGYTTTGLGNIMKDRINLAQKAGCDAVEFDNYDVYQIQAVSGLFINYAVQLDYFKYLANYARSLGLSVCLKNNQTQAKDLFNLANFALGDNCDSTTLTCNYLSDFVNNNKPAFGISLRENYPQFVKNADYQQICFQYISSKYSWIIRTKNQDSYHLRCSIVKDNNDNIIEESSAKNLYSTFSLTVLAIILSFIF